MRCSNRRTDLLRFTARLGAALAVVWGSACGPPPYVPPSPPASDPATVLDVVREREQRIVSLRAAFQATASYDAGESDVQGVLLVRKPDRFRMRLMLPFGITVMDYVSHGDRFWTVLPLTKGERSEETRLFSPTDVRETFLRGPAAFPGTCAATNRSAGDVAVVCRLCEDCPPRRSMTLERRGATIVEETSYDAGSERLKIRYGDYREVSGLPLPFHVVMTYPDRRLEVEIRIRSYEVNPRLKDELFTPPRQALPEKARTRFDELRVSGGSRSNPVTSPLRTFLSKLRSGPGTVSEG